MMRHRFPVPGVGLVLALSAPPVPARADCVDDCQRGFSCFSVGTDDNMGDSPLQAC